MEGSGLILSGVRAVVDIPALLQGRVKLQVEGGLVRLSHKALEALLPANLPVQLVSIQDGRVRIRTRFTAIGGVADVVLRVTRQGRLRAEIVGFRAAGLLPIPVGAVLLALRSFLPRQPWIHFGEGDQLEMDLAHLARGHGIELPPLQGAGADHGWIELRC